ncbi:hypothetical protein [Nostoc sp. NMS9]|uniref:hypothetical protein n=1 Tax=Nostoc sp. NMS9 TaxID=2815393 RepID=UPI0025E31FDB|nr:hypothetical protein [Nostoc sp. NMS9]
MQRIENVVFIHFDGDPKPVQLRKEAAEAFLRILQDNSLTVYATESTSENDRGLSATFEPSTPEE